jgi:hypothetical protein
MRTRCKSPVAPNFHLYGGRGITVCERWDSFEAFVSDLGERPDLAQSLDRIDVEGNYEPGNCRWATSEEQGNNRRTNRWIEAFGRRQTLKQWSSETGIPQTTLAERLDAGMSPQDALSKPSRPSEKLLTLEGETMNLKDWAARLGLSASAITVRIGRGWPLERVLTPRERKRSTPTPEGLRP